MSDLPNVFEHQLFLLRRPGEASPVKRSFREIMTSGDDAYALAYPQEYYNVAALNLMAFLVQVAFEPETVAELAARVETPLTEDEFERGVAPWRSQFLLLGDGPRFMQAPAPEDPKKASGIEEAVFVTSGKPASNQADKRFLFRSDPDWAVAPEQAGLFLFTRNTFYEGTAGRGYQKGTNGDTPVRTLVTIPADGDTIRLRKSIWLNVLAREVQYGPELEGAYARPGRGYDDFFWVKPPGEDIPIGGITLKSGLGWMTAFHWLHFEETDGSFVCPVTGEPVSGLVARTLTKRSTGVAYGTKGDMDSGARAERLFRHPNVPTFKIQDKKTGQYGNEQPYMVDRERGLVDALGSTFFGARNYHRPDKSRFLAPAVAQLYRQPLHDLGYTPRLLVFGFHMLSKQRNVHGGFERAAFSYRLIGRDEQETTKLMDSATAIVDAVSAAARNVARLLQRAVQTTTGAAVRATVDDEGRIKLEKPEITRASDFAFGREVLDEYWRAVQTLMGELAGTIAARADEGGREALEGEAADILLAEWSSRLANLAARLYEPVFETYATLPRTMPFAHNARRWFYGALKKVRSPEPQTPEV